MYKLIIIDDEKIIRETIGAQIDWGSLDIELVGLCSNGMEGLDMIIDENPDIVMTDIRMPVFSGLDLIEKIRQLNRNIEFIILSGYSKFEYARKAMKYNVKHYILKPCSKETIIKTVEQAKKDCSEKKSMGIPFKKVGSLSQEFVNRKRLPEEVLSDLFKLLPNSQDCDYARAVVLSFVTNIWYSYNNICEPSKYYSELKNAKNIEEIKHFLKCHLEFIFEELNKNSVPANNSKGFIDKCIEYTKENYSDPSLTLKHIAEKHLYMNVDYISRQFYKTTGIKFSAFLGRVRVENAIILLQKNPDEKIYVIAEMVGCGNNPQYLSQLFKKYVGMTPSAYLNTLKNSNYEQMK